MGLSAQTANISGSVFNANDQLLNDISVTLQDENGTPLQSVAVDANGAFQFTDLPTGQSYTLHCESTNDYLNQITTFDIIKIARHVLGIQAITGTYNLIAADYNQNQMISTLDIVLIKKHILAIDPPLTNPWLFFYDDLVPASTQSTPITLTGDVTGLEIIGVQLGNILD
jgi:hypothetical protein